VAIVVSVDRVMDMGVTPVNVVGDLVVSSVLAFGERVSNVDNPGP
jgi:Na+/H+-dicarboxylate symporter